MKEMNKEQVNGQGENQTEGEPAGASTTEGGTQQPAPVPYDRFQEVIAERNADREALVELQKQMAKLAETQEADELTRLEQEKEFEKLAGEWKGKHDQLKPQFEATQEELEAHQAALQSFADSQIDQVPELYRDIVAEMPLLNRLRWLAENQEKLTEEQKRTAIPKTPKGTSTSSISDEERKKRAATAWR